MKYALVYDEVDTCRITVMVVKKNLRIMPCLKTIYLNTFSPVQC